METFENKKRYEWTTGTRNGKVETYIAEDEINVYFESGRFVPKEQFDYQLRQIDELIFQQKFNAQQAPPPPPVQMDMSEWEKMLGNPTDVAVQPTVQQTQTIEEQNPIKIILDKQRKKETLTILLDINIDVPNKKVIELLDVMFERDEVIEEIIKSSIKKLDIETIEQNVKESVRQKVLSLFDDEKDDSQNEMQTG
jgi:hypothetical protein